MIFHRNNVIKTKNINIRRALMIVIVSVMKGFRVLLKINHTNDYDDKKKSADAECC